MSLSFEFETTSVTAESDLHGSDDEPQVEESITSIDKLLDPVIKVVEEPVNVKVQKPAASCNDPLFYDLETIPNSRLEDRFELPEIPPEIVITPTGEIDKTFDDVLTMSIPKISDYLRQVNPDDEWLSGLLETENKRGKGSRKGVEDAVSASFKQREERDTVIKSRLKKMATTPTMLKIIAVGVQTGVNGETEGYVAESEDDSEEAELLDLLWQRIAQTDGPLVGYNILSFDMRAFLIRSAMLGVMPIKRFNLSRYSTSDVLDLMIKLYPDNQMKGLKWTCKNLGIEIDARDVEGSQVLGLWNEPDRRREIGVYVKSDVKLCVDIYSMFKGYLW